MHPHEGLVTRFYASLDRRDAEGMVSCYHKEIVFRDPVFGELKGRRAGEMWRMLVARGKDLRVQVSDIRADENTGSATWVATYTIGKKRRKVRNVIRARFEFKDGLIWRHTDEFDLWAWARMALGPAGWLTGWSSPVQARIRREAQKGLDEWTSVKL